MDENSSCQPHEPGWQRGLDAARATDRAGFATCSGSAGHAGATASIKLTFHLDHSMWAAQAPLANRTTFAIGTGVPCSRERFGPRAILRGRTTRRFDLIGG
jgi:hypothetical protein